MLLGDFMSLFRRKKEAKRGDTMGPRAKALELYRKHFNIDENISNENFETDLDILLKCLNIKLYSVNMEELFPNTPNPQQDVSACIRKEEGQFIIYVNEDELLERQRFSIAHEIAHYYLGHLNDDKSMDICFRNQKSSTGRDKNEIEANRFASTLLMPKKMVQQMYDVGLYPEEMAKLFNVSKSAMHYRLKGLNLDC